MGSCSRSRSSSLDSRARAGGVAALLISFASFALVACGGGPKEEAKAPESDPWSSYSGKYTSASDENPKSDSPKSDSAKSDSPKSDSAKSDSPKSDPHRSKAEAKESRGAPKETAEAAPAAGSSKKRSTSTSTIQGESISLISAEELSTASKNALSSKVLSSKLMVGPQYEQLQIQLKGAAVQIIRPAQSPNPSGPAVSSPKSRNGALSATESGWYDEAADVLVVVNAGKKAGAQKALGSILKH